VRAQASRNKDGWELPEPITAYNAHFPGQNSGLRPENSRLWKAKIAFLRDWRGPTRDPARPAKSIKQKKRRVW